MMSINLQEGRSSEYNCNSKENCELGYVVLTTAVQLENYQVLHVSLVPGRLSFKSDVGDRRKFWNEPLKGTRFLFFGSGLNISLSLRGTLRLTRHKAIKWRSL